ncbi:MAG TPA: substrate-binding domain-containing protein [Gaiellaceae bacterium]|nr:substrate-binding domain-containing protein [Gaiellaceae bacterium]
MTDRKEFLRRAGVGAAGLSAGGLLAPPAALAGGGGGDFPDHPRWRFVFVSHSTLDPLLVATQFGAQDAAALVNCTTRWTGSPRGSAGETLKALRSAITSKADGIAVSVFDTPAFAAQVETARRARIPVVAFNVDTLAGGPRLAYVGEDPYISGSRVGAEIARLSAREAVAVLAPAGARAWVERRLEGILGGLSRTPRAARATVLRLQGDVKQQQSQIEKALDNQPRLRGLYSVDQIGTTAAGTVIKERKLRARGFHGGGYDLLPDDLSLVADGYLDFVVDQQPYVQGFVSVMQLFLARISEHTVVPWDTETSVLLRAADVKTFLATKSRFEGSSSRHEYPLRRG